MFRFQRCVLGIGLALFGCAAAVAAPPLTVVQDILFNADGTRFGGIATISWPAFEASDTSTISAHSITTQIVNGLLRVQLVPTTNALSPAAYTVIYNSNNVQFTEYWAVAPSSVPLRLGNVRIGSPGTVIGGGGGGGVTPPPVQITVGISDVTGLSAALTLRPITGTGYTPSRTAVINATGALDGAIGSPGDCVHVDGTSGACGSTTTTTSSPVFVDGEIPVGVVNGANAVFSLGGAPAPATSLAMFRNGLRLRNGADFTFNAAQVTFAGSTIPQTNDLLIATYRMGTPPTTYSFVDGEIPAGNTDGVNTSFTLTKAPNPVASLALYRNGLRLRGNLDYTISGTAVVFQPGLAPQSGDVLVCSYRVAGVQ